MDLVRGNVEVLQLRRELRQGVLNGLIEISRSLAPDVPTNENQQAGKKECQSEERVAEPLPASSGLDWRGEGAGWGELR